MQNLEGKVTRIIHRNNRNYYTIMLVRTSVGTVTVVGNFPWLYRKLSLSMFGQWKVNPKHGKQFVSDSYHIIEPRDNMELVDFLVSDFIECPFSIADTISTKIGVDYLKIYKDQTKVYSKFGLINDAIKSELAVVSMRLDSFYQKKKQLDRLAEMGFKQELCSKIVFSNNPPLLKDIEENPYILIRRYDIDWKTIDEIALKNSISEHSPLRVKEAIYYLLDEASNSEAHMYLPLHVLEHKVQEFLSFDVDLKLYLSQLQKEERVLKDVTGAVYTMENHQLEEGLATNLYRLFKSDSLIDISSYSFTSGSFAYSKDQIEAIEMAIKSQVSIVCGPAGTGKTTIVQKMINDLSALGYDIQLCAPTGRAAKRMTEVTKIKALTIHQLLGFDSETKRPFHDKDYPLEKTCFIVDEASMIDVKIASYLVQAIKSGCKLVIIGDVHQLPSIGPGKVLYDLLTAGLFPTKELKEIFRQKDESQILNVATKVRNGEQIDFSLLPSKSDFKMYNLKNQRDIKNLLKKLIERFHANDKYDIFEDLQVISPVHKGELGCISLNAMIQDIVNPSGQEFRLGSKLIRKGDKVIQLNNNYDKHVYNGDTGRVVAVYPKDKEIVVRFDDTDISYIEEEIFEIDLAYCLTVHKVQGGEFPFILMPYHKAFGDFMLTRKLLYTAITRAKKQFVMIGDEDLVNQSILNNRSDVRYTDFINRLKEKRLLARYNMIK